jgi:hypothetical protein
MTSHMEQEEFLLQVEEAMSRLSLDVLRGRCSVSPLNFAHNDTVEQEVATGLTRMRLQEMKERRYTEGQLQLPFPVSGGPPHYLGDLRYYNDGRPHAPLRYDKPLPHAMTQQEKEMKKQKIISDRNTEEEQLINFLQTQEISRRVEKEEDLFAMENEIFATQDMEEEEEEEEEEENFMQKYESLSISSSPSYTACSDTNMKV